MVSLLLASILPWSANAAVVDDVLKGYQANGASDFSAQRGEAMWMKDHPDPDDPESHFNGYYPETHLRNVRCPTLIIQAEKGMLGNQEIQKALNILPEAYLITLKGAPHEFLTRESEPVIKALNAFLEAII